MAKVPKLQNSSVIKFKGPVGYKMKTTLNLIRITNYI